MSRTEYIVMTMKISVRLPSAICRREKPFSWKWSGSQVTAVYLLTAQVSSLRSLMALPPRGLTSCKLSPCPLSSAAAPLASSVLEHRC